MNIYVAGINWQATSDDLKELFEQYGEVTSCNIIMDKMTGKSRGFGFVEMADDSAKSAIEALNDTDFMGKKITVNEARPRTEGGGGGFKKRGGGGFNRGGGGGFNRGGGGGGNRDFGKGGGFKKRY